MKVAHYDFYRLKKEKEIFNIGLFDTAKDFINIIEWPEIAMNLFNDFLQIKFILISVFSSLKLLIIYHVNKLIFRPSKKFKKVKQFFYARVFSLLFFFFFF